MQASDLNTGDRHGVQDVLANVQHKAAEIWHQLVYRLTHLGG